MPLLSKYGIRHERIVNKVLLDKEPMNSLAIDE